MKTSHPEIHTQRKDLSPGSEITARGQAPKVDLAWCHIEQENDGGRIF